MPKHSRARSGRDLSRRPPKRPLYPRVLIVCEGTKTEVNYFEEIRQAARLSAVNVRVIPSTSGTEPKQIVESAEAEFSRSKAFERVYVVFDRDAHLTYATAIEMAEARDGKLKNDEKKPASFAAVVSVPCFELWLLLHFANIMAPKHRDEAFAELKEHFPGYQKGNTDVYATTLPNLTIATERAIILKQKFHRKSGAAPYTDVHELVVFLKGLRND